VSGPTGAPHGLLTIAQAAQALAVSPRTLRRRIESGAIAVLRDGGIVRVPSAELRRYVASKTVRAKMPARPAGRALAPGSRLW
jgi:excisionase family DNA binding protein